MDATPQTNLDKETLSDHLDSGNLDSDFFCELNGITTQFPHKSDSFSADVRGDLVPFDRDSILEQDVEEQRTNIPLHKQGKTKILFIAGLVSVPMTGVLVMLQGGGSSEPEKIVQVAAEVTPPKTEEFAPDPRFAVAQSKLAMQQQEQQLLAAANAQKLAEIQKATTIPAIAETGASNVAIAASNPPIQPLPVIAAPEAIVNSIPTNVQPPIIPAPAPIRVIARPKTDNLPPVRSISRKQPVQPFLVASRGISVLPSPRPTVKFIPPATPPVVKPTVVSVRVPHRQAPIKPVSWQQATAGGVAVFGVRGETQGDAAQVAQVSQSADPVSSVAAIQARVAIPGQSRSVTLITPLQILGGESTQETLIGLDRAFIDTNGGTLIPARTMIAAQILVADNGMLRIGSAKAIINGVEYPIAAGNLMIAGINNTPLLAEMKKFGDGEIGKRDLGTFFMGALQGIGKVLTTPDTQSQVTAAGTAISTTTAKPNILGGVLDGGASPLVQAWVDRNQAEIKRIEGATRIWFLPAGTKLNLLTTRAFEVK